ncbi:glycosyltransferase family 4 protein [Paenibacillus rigui]|uniref:Spore coat protein n=1 Tax=Paenibacillus rigui TaxID=554312 RepID=A0A229UQ26_9BACL|nr:glycosyltransferase family 4 protein [Paenibacillus rigui]OXM85470.1 spore coat protein [Paenibacillus rigui]
MRILIIAPEQIPVPPVMGGSVEICIFAIAKKLARQHEVTVISRKHGSYPKRSVIGGVNIVRVPTGSPKTYLSHVKSYLSGKSYDWIQIDNRPRFLHAIKQMFPHTPVSLFLHSLTFVSSPRLSRKEGAVYLRKADLIIANSASLKRELSRRFPGAAGRIRKVWLGVDVERFRPAKRKQAGSYTLLFAGRIIPRKGIPVLLKAVHLAKKRSSRLKLLIAGGSNNKGYGRQMRSLSKRLGVSATFLGTIPHRRMHKIYARADCFVCPSQGHEAFGLVNVEAMASGLPVIASDNGGIKEIVKHQRNGLLVRNYKHAGAFAEAIVKLAGSRKLTRQLGAMARKDSVRLFSWQATASRLQSIYRSAAAKQKKKGG